MVSGNYYPKFPKKRIYTCSGNSEYQATMCKSFVQNVLPPVPSAFDWRCQPNLQSSPLKKRKHICDSKDEATSTSSTQIQLPSQAVVVDFYRTSFAPLSPCPKISNCEYRQLEKLWRPWNHSSTVQIQMPKLIENINRDSKILGLGNSVQVDYLESHRKIKWQKCKLCSQEFTRRDNLTRHLKSKHNFRSRPGCQFCFKLLSRKDAVLRHELNCQFNYEKQR